MTRRNFIRNSASAFALFSIMPRHVIAGSGMTPPSEQVTMLAIGAGGRAHAQVGQGEGRLRRQPQCQRPPDGRKDRLAGMMI